MARNTDIETGRDLDKGIIQLTMLSPSENKRCGGGERTALLTVRGKDHDMSADQLEELGQACLKYARLIRENK